MPELIKLCGEYIELGDQRQLSLNIARLPSRTKIDIPIYVNRAHKDGPTLLLLAGLHGDETNGIEIVRRLLTGNYLIPKKGTVIAIPILNIYGFINMRRETPEGKDINRSFPGSENGSLASRIAYAFTNEVLPAVDIGIDFHTGGSSRTNYPQVRCDFSLAENLEYAKAFAPPYIVNSQLMDKTIRKTSQKLGKPLLVYEGGESLRFDSHSIEEGIAGTRRLMHHLGMVEHSKKQEHDTIIVDKTGWLRANYSGLFRPTIKCGESIKKNQIMGFINDPYGEFESKIKAPHDGYVFGVNNSPVAHQGEALFHIGQEMVAKKVK